MIAVPTKAASSQNRNRSFLTWVSVWPVVSRYGKSSAGMEGEPDAEA